MCLYTTWMRYFIEEENKIDGDEKGIEYADRGRAKIHNIAKEEIQHSPMKKLKSFIKIMEMEM